MVAAAAMNVSGSRTLTPYTTADITRPKTMASATEADAQAGEHEGTAQHLPHDLAARGAERDPHADLARAPSDRERHDTEQTDRREHEAQQSHRTRRLGRSSIDVQR